MTSPGFVTAYGCDDGLPTNADGTSARSDLNYDPHASPVASNRLIVQADDNGDVCFYTYKTVAMIVDVNGVTFDTGVSSFANRRTDTRRTTSPVIPADGVLRVSVPEAAGGKTVIGQLTVDRVTEPGYVTAYPCAQGIPADRRLIAKSDLNYDPNASPVASNRLVAQADAKGDVCFSTMKPVAMIVDVNGVSDVGIRSFANRRTDTREAPAPVLPGGGVLRLNVPEAVGNKTVIGQLTVDRVTEPGWVAAYPCAAGLPTGSDGVVSRSDLNYDPNASPVASNRLIVQADANGDVCLQTLRPTALIVDINGVAGAGISSFPNRRTDTRRDVLPPGSIAVASTPAYPPFTPRPPLIGVAALTGAPTDADVTSRPIVAVKIDNYGPARPQWGIDQADAVFEENVEGISRFLALFHSRLPDTIGPVRSARTQDIDLLAAMNRPVFAFSGGQSRRGRLDRLGGSFRRARRPRRPDPRLLRPHNRATRPAQPADRSVLRDRHGAERRPGRAAVDLIAVVAGPGRRHARHHVRRGDGRRRHRLGVGRRVVPAIPGRPAPPRRVGRPAVGEQRRRAGHRVHPLARRCPLTERGHRRHRPGHRPPWRRRRADHVAA